MCIGVFTRVFMYVNMLHKCVHVGVCVNECACVCSHVHVGMCMCTCVFVCLCVYEYDHVCFKKFPEEIHHNFRRDYLWMVGLQLSFSSYAFLYF